MTFKTILKSWLVRMEGHITIKMIKERLSLFQKNLDLKVTKMRSQEAELIINRLSWMRFLLMSNLDFKERYNFYNFKKFIMKNI